MAIVGWLHRSQCNRRKSPGCVTRVWAAEKAIKSVERESKQQRRIFSLNHLPAMELVRTVVATQVSMKVYAELVRSRDQTPSPAPHLISAENENHLQRVACIPKCEVGGPLNVIVAARGLVGLLSG